MTIKNSTLSRAAILVCIIVGGLHLMDFLIEPTRANGYWVIGLFSLALINLPGAYPKEKRDE